MKFIWLCIFLSLPVPAFTQNPKETADNRFHFPATKGTSYEILNKITDISGFLFIYDSKTINNEQKVRIPEGMYTLEEIISLATGVKNLQTKIFDKHILLYLQKEAPPPAQPVATPQAIPSHIILEGTVRERESGDPIPYCSVGIMEMSIGSVTNQNGQFLLKIPDSLQYSYIYLSHIGYEAQRLPVELVRENNIDIYMDTRLVPLEAVIINLVNPQKVVRDMLNNRKNNYQTGPFYITAFYREGVNKKKGFISLTEAVFQIYKPGYGTMAADQVKLLKKRNITNELEQDTVIMKMKAGIQASLMLDLIKNLPDFLTLNEESMYHYSKVDMTVTNEHWAHVIAFEQKPGIKGPLYKGELYIDANNSALLNVYFQIHPAYIKQAQEMLIAKKSRNIEITPVSAIYSVSYQQWNGKYYINHIRGDLDFRIKKKKQLLPGSSTLHTYFEMVTCQIDTVDVKRFSMKQSLPTHKIFSETNFTYDGLFWENFNIIMPEERLSEAISRITSKIEEIQ